MTSWATKHARAIVNVDAYVRSQAPDGSRYHVRHSELSEHLQIHKANVSGALNTLAHMKDAGYSKVTGGEYEFIMPEFYPQELQELKDSLHGSLARPTRRGRLTTEVVEWLSKQPAGVLTVAGAAAELECASSSISAIFQRLGLAGILTPLPGVGAGVYRYEPGVAALEQPGQGRPTGAAAQVAKDLAEHQRITHPREPERSLLVRIGEDAPEDAIYDKPHDYVDLSSLRDNPDGSVSRRPTPDVMPKTRPPKDTMYRQLRATASGKIIVQGPDGTLYWLKEID